MSDPPALNAHLIDGAAGLVLLRVSAAVCAAV